MVNVKERHLLELLSQHKANRLDKLDALKEIRKVEQLDMTEIFIAGHVTFPQKVPLKAGAEDVDEKVETRSDLEDVVDGEESFQLIRLSPLHKPAIIESSSTVAHRQSKATLTPGLIEGLINKHNQSPSTATPTT